MSKTRNPSGHSAPGERLIPRRILAPILAPTHTSLARTVWVNLKKDRHCWKKRWICRCLGGTGGHAKHCLFWGCGTAVRGSSATVSSWVKGFEQTHMPQGLWIDWVHSSLMYCSSYSVERKWKEHEDDTYTCWILLAFVLDIGINLVLNEESDRSGIS